MVGSAEEVDDCADFGDDDPVADVTSPLSRVPRADSRIEKTFPERCAEQSGYSASFDNPFQRRWSLYPLWLTVDQDFCYFSVASARTGNSVSRKYSFREPDRRPMLAMSRERPHADP